LVTVVEAKREDLLALEKRVHVQDIIHGLDERRPRDGYARHHHELLLFVLFILGYLVSLLLVVVEEGQLLAVEADVGGPFAGEFDVQLPILLLLRRQILSE